MNSKSLILIIMSLLLVKIAHTQTLVDDTKTYEILVFENFEKEQTKFIRSGARIKYKLDSNPKYTYKGVIEKITDKQRRAIAPYNFVELPEQIVPAQQPLPEGDRYYTHLHTGRIDCTLTTESPLYIRCGLTPEQFKEAKEAKDLPEFFYLDPETKKPVLPGSSLRGMLRILVEIASFSKIEQVSDAQ